MGMVIFNLIMALVCFIFAVSFLVRSFTLRNKMEKVEEEVAQERDARANGKCGKFNVYYSGDVVLTPNVTATVHNYSTGDTIITDLIVNGYSLYKHLPANLDYEQEYRAALNMLQTQGLPSGTVNHVDIEMIEELYSDLNKLSIELYYGTIEYSNRNKKFTWVG